MPLLPHADVGEVLGLVETIYAYGEKVTLAKLAEESRIPIDDLLDIVDFAEKLKLLKIKGGKLTLTTYGELLVIGNIDDKKRTLRKLLKKQEPFSSVIKFLKRRKGKVKIEELMEYLRKLFPISREKEFKKILFSWGGYTEMFEVDSKEGEVFLSKA